ncbi:phosphodiesterase [Anopheles sinensis]|uniref:Phosphodiesterase n=1 Tax=Anopheles sinensis TaxID=74873 RepID=A0A084VKP9_ANOSI|nr:phosphodiesterase [Anopheles sinensis]
MDFARPATATFCTTHHPPTTHPVKVGKRAAQLFFRTREEVFLNAACPPRMLYYISAPPLTPSLCGTKERMVAIPGLLTFNPQTTHLVNFEAFFPGVPASIGKRCTDRYMARERK